MTEENSFTMSEKKEDNFLDGYYLGAKQINGRDGVFTVHTVHKVNKDGELGEKFDVSGNKVLNDLMDTVRVGAYVGIQYMGRRHKQGYEGKKWTQTNSYHTWKLFEDSSATPYGELEGADNVAEEKTSKSTPPAGKSDAKATSKPASNAFPEDDNDDLPF